MVSNINKKENGPSSLMMACFLLRALHCEPQAWKGWQRSEAYLDCNNDRDAKWLQQQDDLNALAHKALAFQPKQACTLQICNTTTTTQIKYVWSFGHRPYLWMCISKKKRQRQRPHTLGRWGSQKERRVQWLYLGSSWWSMMGMISSSPICCFAKPL